MADEPRLATKRIDIDACGGPRRRTARKGVRLEVRAAMVALAPPGNRPQTTPPLSMMAVHVTEPSPPADREPLEEDAARQRRRGLCRRCPQDRLLLREALVDRGVFSRPEGWHPHQGPAPRPGRRPAHVSRLRRHHRMPRHDHRTPRPRASPRHRQATSSTETKSPSSTSTTSGRKRTPRAPPEHEPTIEAFAIGVARIAGFIPRTRQPLPGTEKVWQGYRILLTFVENDPNMRELDMLKSTESTASG